MFKTKKKREDTKEGIFVIVTGKTQGQMCVSHFL
jgi:hypothetical protein